MKRIALTSALLALMLGAATAHAQALRTWVSSGGNDGNSCSRAAPCRTFVGAISKTAANGEIHALDPDDYGPVSISKAITIDGGGHRASISGPADGFAIAINAPAGAAVQLRNLDLEGHGASAIGINFLAGSALHVENVTIRNFTFRGISFRPEAAAKLFVMNATISDNFATLARGITVQPQAGSHLALATLVGVKLLRNREGLSVGGRARVSVESSVASGGVFGALANCSEACNIIIARSMFTNNQTGVEAFDAATVRLSDVAIVNNTTGISALNGAVISYGDNQIGGNGTNGAPTSTTPQQ